MCGVSGASGPNISKDKLKILSLYNDSRGGDSCGIWDGELKTSFNEKHKDGKGYFWTVLPDMEFKIAPTVLFHARAASPGIEVNALNAHPFVIGNIVGTHNGIIRNVDQLCEKYGVEKVKSDSKSLFKIIEHLKTKPKIVKLLSEYIGAAALAWTDTNEPGSLYLYRGESKKLPDGEFVWEERPLFIGKVDNTLYYSSLETSLKTIEAKLIDFEGNYLYKFVNGIQKSKTFVDRTKAHQDIPVVYKHYQGTMFEGPKPMKALPSVSKKFTDDKLFSELLPDGFLSPGGKGTRGKIYFHKGQYYRNGHLISKGECRSLMISDEGFQYWGVDELDEKTGIWTKYDKEKNVTIQGATYHFFHGSMFVDAGAALSFKYAYFKDGKLVKLDINIDKYFRSPVNFNFINEMYEFKSNVISQIEGWWTGKREGEFNLSGSRLHGWVTFPLSDTAYRFANGHCMEIVPKKEEIVPEKEKIIQIVQPPIEVIDDADFEEIITMDTFIKEKEFQDEFVEDVNEVMASIEEFTDKWEPSSLTKAENACYKIIEDTLYSLIETAEAI